MPLTVIAGLAFVAVAGGIVGFYMLAVSRSRMKHLRRIESRLLDNGGPAEAADTPDGESLLRTVDAGALPGVDRVARLAIKGSSLERWLWQSGTRISVGTLCLVSLLLGIAGGGIAVSASHRAWAMIPGFAVGLFIMPAMLKRKRTGRINRFEEHFPEALDLISRAIRAGHAFSAGMKMVADEASEPVGPEFRKAFDEQNFGMPLKETLNNLADRVPLLDVRFFATAVLIQRETGGNLSEILDNLANVVRERFKIRRQVRVHTAHGRFTGYVLLALPAFLAVALMFINPEHMRLLFDEPMGQMMIVASIILQATGFLWIKQVVKIEV